MDYEKMKCMLEELKILQEKYYQYPILNKEQYNSRTRFYPFNFKDKKTLIWNSDRTKGI
jgi:hypothetical protein